MKNTSESKDTNLSQNTCKVKNFIKKLGFKKIAIITILVIVFIGFIPVTSSLNFSTTEDYKWVVVGKEYTHENIILGEYGAYIQQNYSYIEKNPYLLMNFLNGLINQHVSSLIFANEAKKLDIAVSNNLIIDLASQIPLFQNDKKEFDPEKFKLQMNNLYGSEEIFLYDAKVNMLKDQLLDATYSNIKQPEYIAYLDYLAITQKRNISYLEIDPSTIKISKNPTDAELITIKDKNKSLFTVPEKRDVTVITIDTKDLKNQIKVTKEEIKKYYNENINNYMDDEKREVSQLIFSSEKEADEAFKKMSALSKAEIKKQYKMSSIGKIYYKDFPKELSTTIFSTQNNKVSNPVKSSIGWHIFLIENIVPNQPKELKTVENEISLEVLELKKQEKIEEYKNSFINLLNQNKSLEEIAKTLNAKSTSYNSINSNFNKLEPTLLKEIFSSNVNNSPILQNDLSGNLIAYKVTNITNERLQDIKEIKNELVKIWRDNEIKIQINNKSNELTSKLVDGSDINKLGIKVKKSTISMVDEKQILSDISLKPLFSTKINQPIILTLKNGNTCVAIVTNIINDKINYINKDGSKNQQISNFANYSSQSYSQEFLQTMSTNLNKKYKIKVNNKAILNKLAPKNSENK